MRAIRHALREQRLFRAPVIRARMLLRPRRVDPGGVVFLVYHHVRRRHRSGFERQLERLRKVGELVGVAEALASLSLPSAPPVQGRRICLTFDDGWGDAARHAGPILIANGVPAAFFVVSDWVGMRGHVGWDDLRRLSAAGMTIGSHTASHPRLARLDGAAAHLELHRSREAIAEQTGVPCSHFAAPFGQPGEDFRSERDPAIARALGYRSFFTTVPSRALPGQDPFILPRIRMEPSWGRDEIAYALWR